jgi:hypothetical protein
MEDELETHYLFDVMCKHYPTSLVVVGGDGEGAKGGGDGREAVLNSI